MNRYVLEAKVETIIEADDFEEAMGMFLEDLIQQGLVVNELNAEYAATVH